MVLIGIGVIVSLPVRLFLTRVRIVKESEVHESVSSINQYQQAYFAEKNVFSTSIKTLRLAIKTENKITKISL